MDDKPATVPRVEVGSLASLRLVFAVEAIAAFLPLMSDAMLRLWSVKMQPVVLVSLPLFILGHLTGDCRMSVSGVYPGGSARTLAR